jgi:hypothetical protein
MPGRINRCKLLLYLFWSRPTLFPGTFAPLHASLQVPANLWALPVHFGFRAELLRHLQFEQRRSSSRVRFFVLFRTPTDWRIGPSCWALAARAPFKERKWRAKLRYLTLTWPSLYVGRGESLRLIDGRSPTWPCGLVWAEPSDRLYPPTIGPATCQPICLDI